MVTEVRKMVLFWDGMKWKGMGKDLQEASGVLANFDFSFGCGPMSEFSA